MFEITAENAADYLRERGLIEADEQVIVRQLTGGISNEVLLVERADVMPAVSSPAADDRGLAGDFVIKQARPQLRTPQPWFSSVERNWREAAVQRLCANLAPGHVPRVLFEDRENYLFAMSAVPAGHRVWREELLAGRIDPALGAQCGRLLAALHVGTWHDAQVAVELGDRTLFYELRVAPYYETVARDVPEARDWLRRLIESLAAPARSLVHADFSPKNLLLVDSNLTLVDYETGHYGDPAFDLGFFLAHLVLKTFYHATSSTDGAGRLSSPAVRMLTLIQQFWGGYLPVIVERIGLHQSQELSYRGLQHLAGCLWARLDGTSRIDYLTEIPVRELVRQLCREIFRQGPTAWSEVESRIRDALCIASPPIANAAQRREGFGNRS
ncbi:MAG: phosphotransferase [Pirellulales bacterium]